MKSIFLHQSFTFKRQVLTSLQKFFKNYRIVITCGSKRALAFFACKIVFFGEIFSIISRKVSYVVRRATTDHPGRPPRFEDIAFAFPVVKPKSFDHYNPLVCSLYIFLFQANRNSDRLPHSVRLHVASTRPTGNFFLAKQVNIPYVFRNKEDIRYRGNFEVIAHNFIIPYQEHSPVCG